MLLTLERLVDLVVGDAEHAHSRLGRLVPLREHDELGHERHEDRLAVEVGSHARRLADVLTVHQPKPAHAAHTFTCNTVLGNKTTQSHTWLRVTESDLRPLNISHSHAWKNASSLEYWPLTVDVVVLTLMPCKRQLGIERVQAPADISRSALCYVIATKPVHRLQIRPIVHNYRARPTIPQLTSGPVQ